MVPEAPPKQTEEGLGAVGGGWFVLNAHEARWNHRLGRQSVSFTGSTEFEADTYFPQLGVNLAVLAPGEPNSMYHWETETEAFLVLSGEVLLIVEGQERPLRQWDFVHCPQDGTRDRWSWRGPLRRPGDELARESGLPAVRRVHRGRGRAPPWGKRRRGRARRGCSRRACPAVRADAISRRLAPGLATPGPP